MSAVQMAASELDDLRSESIPTPTRRFRHTVKPEVKNADGSMEGPKTDSNNLIVVTGSTGEFTNGESEHDLLRFENVMESDCDCNVVKWFGAAVIQFMGCFMVFLIITLLTGTLYFLYEKMEHEALVTSCLCLMCALIAYYLIKYPWTIISTRVIKWTLEEFSKEMRGYFFTSPTIHDKSGSWRLVLRQVSDEEANFGLITTEIAEGIAYVVANVEISTKIRGQNTVPGMNEIIKFGQKFEREGDCGYSTPIPLSFEQLKNHYLEIKCRIRFTRKKVIFEEPEKSLFDELKSPFILSVNAGRRFGEYLKCHRPVAPKIAENGVILSETQFQSEMLSLTGTELEGDSLSFMKHPETKAFSWKIPNFSKHIKNVEFWEIFSPKLLVSSHGFCSIWRLQLVELEGVFRIHMQLRGLPHGISKIKMRYLVELMDNCGEFVGPNNCGSTIKYPEYLQLNNTNCRVPLYRREAILERFLDKDDTLTLRISLHCEPKDTVQNLWQPTENAY